MWCFSSRGQQRRQGGAHGLDAGVGQVEVAQVAQPVDGGDIEQRVGGVAQHLAGLADGAWPEAGPGAVGHRAIPGDAGDGEGLLLGGAAPMKPLWVR
jgi:hypothetical protein